MRLRYPAWFVVNEEDGGFTVQLYDIPQCVAGGADMQEATKKAIAVMELIVLGGSYYDRGKPVPLPSPMSEVRSYMVLAEWFHRVGYVELPESLSGDIIAHNMRCEAAERARRMTVIAYGTVELQPRECGPYFVDPPSARRS